jgi:hypothetical protein
MTEMKPESSHPADLSTYASKPFKMKLGLLSSYRDKPFEIFTRPIEVVCLLKVILLICCAYLSGFVMHCI